MLALAASITTSSLDSAEICRYLLAVVLDVGCGARDISDLLLRARSDSLVELELRNRGLIGARDTLVGGD